MGKWAQYSKRGGAAIQGFLAAMVDADWSIGTLTATTIPVNRIAGFPVGADRWGALVVQANNGAVVWNTQAIATPITATGLTSGVTYRVQVAWFIQGTFQRVSDWSPARTVTLP